ncbi:HNH endonuclease-domain-containing protein [Diplogelasinospora grovesii]|uniref:HNH endonuclease-domain-containing protein n=1 Tax=Diplogelasinospora grovesii TaxID=303347 RepID=A0AAN6N8Y2_9PEZI|nr:HNH endonuclease-domain-containing protein [Diplogelasinospora grovesii]
MPGAGLRALGRNVFFYDLRDLDTLLGGLVLTPGVTNADFYAMVNIVLIISSSFLLQNDNGETVLQDSQPLLPGRYFVVADSTIEINNEPVYTRAMSIQTGPRVRVFTEQVRERDKGCVVTKKENLRAAVGLWIGFEAAHIFPLAYEQQWHEYGYGSCITLPPPQGGTINSVQNGLLLRGDMHALFDHYYFSINPDNGYKIVFFQTDHNDIYGTFLDSRLLDDPRRPRDELLRWHFRQAVLSNMRGIGEPDLEQDFPPGSDMMGTIRDGPKAAERMEFELFDRLAHYTDLCSSKDTDGDTDVDEQDADVSDKD